MKTITISSKMLIAILLVAVCVLGFYSFKTPKTNAKMQFMQVNTVESIIPGGLGRSKMIVTKTDGTFNEESLENIYSMVGINFGNIEANDKDIIAKLNNLSAEGWELIQITAGSQSPSKDSDQGIFMTRYLFQKTAE
jgi:hypothetical protein